MPKILQLFVAALALISSLSTVAQTSGRSVQTLRGTDAAAADRAPSDVSALGKRPGAQKPIARTFSTQPPLIPHAVENFDEVTLEDNQCLSCHGPTVFKSKNAPRIGDKHFRDGNPASGEAAGARHACQLCHVPQFDAKPLVENTFRGR